LLKLTCKTVEAGSFRAWTGSVGAVSAVDVEDVTRDEPGFVRRNEDNTVGDLLGEAEPTQRNLAGAFVESDIVPPGPTKKTL
jgi:hypothetical protein